MRTRSLLFPLLVVAATACSSSSAPTSTTPNNLEVFSWFTSGSEQKALTALFGQVTSQHTDIPIANIVNAAQADPTNAQTLLAQRMAAGNPPDSFQVVSGSDLQAWVGKQSLEPLTDVEQAQGWGSVIPVEVLQSVSDSSGVLYGVPLDIERDNTIFYNKSIVSSMPTTIDGIMTLAAQLQASGVTPFEVSDSGGWTMASHVFESVLVAQAGADFYQAYLSGQKSASAPEIQNALATTGQMLDMSNTDAHTTGWAAAVQAVCSGKAAMLVLPDFVKGEFQNDGCGPDKIGYVPMQMSGESTFVFVSVTFALPKGAPDRTAAKEFLETVGSVQGQLAFDLLKGAIPARTDANVLSSGFDSISQQTFGDFTASSERRVPAYAALTSTTFQTAVNTSLQAFADRTNAAYKDVPTVMTVLEANYGQINQL
jgi:glucose/mannose transport system substrate-binding protein